MKKTLSRRDFMLKVGGTSLALPFLPSLLPQALGATGKPPKRFITINHRYGHHAPDFFPVNMPNMTKVDKDTYYTKLSDIPGDISAILNSKYDPYRSKMNIYWGMDSVGGGGHNATVPLTGGGYLGAEGEDSPPLYGKSIDVLMMKSPNFYETLPRFDSIRIGNNNSGISWDRGDDGVAQRLSYMQNNQSVFSSLFGSSTGGTGGQEGNQKQKLIVDKIFDRYKALRDNPRMSAADRKRFESHIATVTDVQKRIQNQGACTVPSFTPPTGPVAAEIVWRNNIDMMVSSMSCDLSRIGVLNIWDFEFGTENNYQNAHGISHARDTDDASAKISLGYSAFKTDQVLYLLQRLNGIIEADGTTMLDNTIVLWSTELTNGNFHVSSSLPIVTFGGGGGALKTGYLLDMRLKPIQYLAGRSDFLAPLGQPYNRLLITIMRAMGLQPAEYMNVGDGGGFGQFNKNISYISDQYTQYIGRRNDPLPIVFG